jgi:hypothetical protein
MGSTLPHPNLRRGPTANFETLAPSVWLSTNNDKRIVDCTKLRSGFHIFRGSLTCG